MTPDEYTRLIKRARDRSLAVDVQVAGRIEEALQSYVSRLTAILQRVSGPRARRVREARAAARGALRQLRSTLDDTIERGIRLSAARVAERQDQATRRFVVEEARRQLGPDASRFIEQFTGGGNLRGASAYLSRIRDGDAAVATRFKTILDRRIPRVAGEVDHIITRGILESADPAELGRRLRGYVTGSEDFRTHLIEETDDAGEVVARKIDLRTVPKQSREAARNLRYKANRIAVTEMSTARHEATVQGMKESPMVEAVKWNLSANRGSVATPDECDLLADADYYGLGRGVYPVGRVPAKPHPFDRCFTTPVMRPLDQWDRPKPDGDLDAEAGDGELTDGTEARRRRAEENAREAVEQFADAA